MLECECGHAVSMVDVDESNGFMNAVEYYECPNGHHGSLVLDEDDPRRIGCLE